MKPTILKPSRVLRLVKSGKLSPSIKGGKVGCQKCKQFSDGQTESPEFWENGMYVYCPTCEKWTLARPEYPGTEGYPNGFVIDLTGERKKYPLVNKAMQTPASR